MQPPSHLRDALREVVLAYGLLNLPRRPCGTTMTAPHAWALLELDARGAMTVGALAKRLRIDRTNVSRLCVKMEKLQEVERAAHPEDGRATMVRLTHQGERAAQGVNASSLRFFERLSQNLGDDTASVVSSLTTLCQALEQTSQEIAP